MRPILLAVVLLAGPSLALGQAADSAPTASTRSFTLVAGSGNAMGWLGLAGEKYVASDRMSVFGGLGYTLQVDEGDASGVTVAAGVRGYTAGTKHRGYLELSVSQLYVETHCFETCRRLYGPGVQAGYQLLTKGGFTLVASLGVGYAPTVSEGPDNVTSILGLGLGYTWRR